MTGFETVQQGGQVYLEDSCCDICTHDPAHGLGGVLPVCIISLSLSLHCRHCGLCSTMFHLAQRAFEPHNRVTCTFSRAIP